MYAIRSYYALTGGTVIGLPYWAVIVFAALVMAIVGMLIERIVIRPVLGYPAFTVVMITIGVGYVLRGVVTMVPGWGTRITSYNVCYTKLLRSISRRTASSAR